MLQVRVLTPPQSCGAAIKAIKANATTANLVVLHGAALDGKGDVLLFDVARETANAIVDALRALGIEKTGSISLHDNVTIISEAADRARQPQMAIPPTPSSGTRSRTRRMKTPTSRGRS
ncbi:hypothetical protein [Mesorhizobium amorphae]|uniref:hypothetical protein n=1 Tax=Mesorhizobium amorphae TaxID=71433 RepID=UPI001186C9EE|nr:hypothetical protein [Mesorhizobium amorphae]